MIEFDILNHYRELQSYLFPCRIYDCLLFPEYSPISDMSEYIPFPFNLASWFWWFWHRLYLQELAIFMPASGAAFLPDRGGFILLINFSLYCTTNNLQISVIVQYFSSKFEAYFLQTWIIGKHKNIGTQHNFPISPLRVAYQLGTVLISRRQTCKNISLVINFMHQQYR